MMSKQMSDIEMQAILQELATAGADDEAILDQAIKDFPEDARLYFLKASAFAGVGRLIEAHAAFKKSIELNPDFHIARFQFGLFQLTSGESDNALKTWARLDGLPKEHYLRVFVIGLRHLIRDEIEDCIKVLERGIELNAENLPLNTDIEMLIEKVRPLLDDNAPSNDDETSDESVLSPTSILLQQSNNSIH